MNNNDLEHYKQMIETRNEEQLNNEKIALGSQISDTAKRVQELSGRDPGQMEKQLEIMKELRGKLSIVIKALQKIREQS